MLGQNPCYECRMCFSYFQGGSVPHRTEGLGGILPQPFWSEWPWSSTDQRKLRLAFHESQEGRWSTRLRKWTSNSLAALLISGQRSTSFPSSSQVRSRSVFSRCATGIGLLASERALSHKPIPNRVGAMLGGIIIDGFHVLAVRFTHCSRMSTVYS